MASRSRRRACTVFSPGPVGGRHCRIASVAASPQSKAKSHDGQRNLKLNRMMVNTI